MAPKFGTSGLRGLVTELTDELVCGYVNAFISTLPACETLFVGRDLRPSSPDISGMVCQAAHKAGVSVVDCGALGTPALALASMKAGAAAIMVTGSHIPADRNGLKFFLPHGEVLKSDEEKISAAYAKQVRVEKQRTDATQTTDTDAEPRYIRRYIDAFGKDALGALRIGVYRHSSVARDTMEKICAGLDATVVPLAHSDIFIPIDTEAVSADTRAMFAGWCTAHNLDAIISTDGDADRPLLTDDTGKFIPGDVLGVLTSLHLGATDIVTPVSSNDMVRRCPEFNSVSLTRIGSPFVIEGMNAVQAGAPDAHVVGFEANGGYLLGFEAQVTGPLPPLMTRDCMLPILAPLHAAKRAGKSLAELVHALPPCFTAADRLQEIDREKAAVFLESLINSEQARTDFYAEFGSISSVDLTDGLRVDFETGDVIHLRPSGNAPEFRIYAQASEESHATMLAGTMREKMARALF